MNAIYPWAEGQWALCRKRMLSNTLPHAVLLSGSPGLGKRDFARWFAQLLLCDKPRETACGHCDGCRVFLAGSHPDYFETITDEDTQQLKIDQIRSLNHFMRLSRSRGHYKVALIANSDAMNRFAANSLLKILEEPPPFSLIVLISENRMQLPPTIVSRCHQITFKPPAREVAAAWLRRELPHADAQELLRLAFGAPIRALELGRSERPAAQRATLQHLCLVVHGRTKPLTVASQWAQCDLDTLLGWMLAWLAELAKLHALGAPSNQSCSHVDPSLRALSERIDSRRLFSLYDEMLGHRRRQQAALNQRLVLEDIILAWAQAFDSTR
jgi:DNA polymerase III subunit delta'